MRKLLVLFLFSLCFMGCTNEDVKPISEEVQYLENHKIFMEKYQNPVSLEGKFQSFANKSNQFIIYSRTEDKKHIFYMEGLSSEELSKLKNQNIKSLTYLDNGILLSKKNFFGVKRNLDKQILQDVEKLAGSSFENQNINVVAHIWFSKSFDLYDEITLKKIKSFHNIKDFMAQGRVHPGNCDSGGPGSTSCSTSSYDSGCDVSCGSGYYACCNNPSFMESADCHCHENE